MGKTVLILGNGFDLAHGLPTKYSDFLMFCNYVIVSINTENNSISQDRLNSLKSIYQLIKNNIWYNYLYKVYANKNMKGENWIDFEFEIRIIIECLDKTINNRTISNAGILVALAFGSTEFKEKALLFKQITLQNIKNANDMSIIDFTNKLLLDLRNLTRALELYLCEFVEKTTIVTCSPDINRLKADYIINFNYTHTFENRYTTNTNKNEVFHIHGECGSATEENSNSMVLGIDEYWSEDECKKYTDFILFKKFAQRTLKGTGVKYLDIINENYDIYGSISKVYIFGHSLDITDKDILQGFINNKATDVTVFCLNEEIKIKLFTNIVKLIGEAKLNEKVNQYLPKLKFVIQQPMVPIEEEEKDLSTSGAAT